MSRVLIVDDDLHLSRAISRSLQPWYAVVEVASMRDARRVLLGGGIDAIVSDWNLGGESGIDLVEAVALEFPHVRRVLMSASKPSHFDRERLRQCDAGFLQKPFAMTALLSTLK